MEGRDRLENFALFYERIDSKGTANSGQHIKEKNRYEHGRGLKKEDLSKISKDLQSPIQQSSQSNPIR